jgi:hypothetical protein
MRPRAAEHNLCRGSGRNFARPAAEVDSVPQQSAPWVASRCAAARIASALASSDVMVP